MSMKKGRRISSAQTTLFGEKRSDIADKKIDESLKLVKPYIRNFEKDAPHWMKDELNELEDISYKRTSKSLLDDLESPFRYYILQEIFSRTFSKKELCVYWYEIVGSFIGVSFMNDMLDTFVKFGYLEISSVGS